MMGFFYVRALDVFRDNSGSVGLNEFITKASSMLLSDGITLVSPSLARQVRRPSLALARARPCGLEQVRSLDP